MATLSLSDLVSLESLLPFKLNCFRLFSVTLPVWTPLVNSGSISTPILLGYPGLECLSLYKIYPSNLLRRSGSPFEIRRSNFGMEWGATFVPEENLTGWKNKNKKVFHILAFLRNNFQTKLHSRTEI